MVPARAARQGGLRAARLLRVVGPRQEIRRHAHHLHRHRALQLDLGPGGQRLLLAPLLFAPARPELRQPARAQGRAGRDEVLAQPGRGRPAARCRALPGGARGHRQREPARDARRAAQDPRGDGRGIQEPPAAGRSQPVARRHTGILRQRRRVPHGLPLSADAAHVHGDRAGGPLPDHRHHAADARGAAHLPVGHLPAQPRRADAGDGDRRGARLPVGGLRQRPPRAAQSRHPPAPGAAAGARPPPRGADEQPAVLDARHAGDVLRRRDRHGRQHPPGRPRRRAHADAVVARPQRRLLARRSGAAGAAGHHGLAVRL